MFSLYLMLKKRFCLDFTESLPVFVAKKPPAKNSTSPPGINGRAPAVGPLESEQIARWIFWFSLLL